MCPCTKLLLVNSVNAAGPGGEREEHLAKIVKGGGLLAFTQWRKKLEKKVERDALACWRKDIWLK